MNRLKYLAMAALVAFAACDESETVVTPPAPVTGTVTGTVTVDGAGLAGISVAMSNGGSATTDAAGRYTFESVAAGSYTVTISGFSDAVAFSQTSAGVVINSTGQVVTQDFAGQTVRTATIFASVTGAGVGLSNVSVAITGASSAAAATDASGQVSFGNLPGGTYQVTISGFDGTQFSFTETTKSVTVATGGSGIVAFDGARVANSTVSGVVTVGGAAAAGVTVDLAGASTAQATTDAAGRYSFGSLLPGSYTVSISGFSAEASFSGTTKAAEVTASGQTVTVDFTGSIIMSSSIAGAVVAGGESISGATVTLTGFGASTTATTDAQGRYSFAGLRAGTYSVALSGFDAAKYAFAATTQDVTVAIGGAATADFTGTIPANSTLSGVVTIDGAAAAGVTVTVGPFTTTTDAQGRYAFSGLPVGNWTVAIAGFPADAQFTTTSYPANIMMAGTALTQDFAGAYIRTAGVAGVVSVAGNPLAGVTVTLTGGDLSAPQTATTAANGQYGFTGLRGGDYTVAISGFDATQATFASMSTNVTLATGGSATANFSATIPANSTVSGVVTVDGNPASGWVVSNGAGISATTDAQGRYTLSGLAVGTYTMTVTKAGVTDVTFAESVVATIPAAGTNATKDFTGTVARGQISGQVTDNNGAAVAGVTITATGGDISGGNTATTAANGSYTISGVRAGTYTVTMSGFDANVFTPAANGVSVTLASAATPAVQNLTLNRNANGTVSGTFFIDESSQNGTLDSTEGALSGNYTVVLTGPAVTNTQTATVTAGSTYSFGSLVPGTYNIQVTSAAPANYTAVTTTVQTITVAAGGTTTQNFGYRITNQTIVVPAFLGRDENASAANNAVATRAKALPGVGISLYPTEATARAVANGGAAATGRLGAQVTTDASGNATFTFARTADTAPQGGQDRIVYALVTGAPAGYTADGETVLEINYNPLTQSFTSADAFDFLNLAFRSTITAKSAGGANLNGWTAVVFQNDTTAPSATSDFATINTSGVGTFNTKLVANVAALPDTFYARLPRAQNNHPGTPAYMTFKQTPSATGVGSVVGSGELLRIVFDGTTLTTDAAFNFGTETVQYTTANVYLNIHRERNDAVGRDTQFDNADNIDVEIFNGAGTTRVVNPALPLTTNGTVGTAAGNLVTITAGTTNTTFQARARSLIPTQQVLVSDTSVTFTVSGNDTIISKATSVPGTYSGSATVGSTFAYKYNNTSMTGNVLANSDNTPAAGVIVTLAPASGNIGGTASRADTADATGNYGFANLVEGTYTVTAADRTNGGAAEWTHVVTVGGNTSATVGSRDLDGSADNDIINFRPTYQQTAIQGVVINDRDGDNSTADPNETADGAVVTLHSGATTAGTVVAVDTISTADAGKYAFSNLASGTYTIAVQATAASTFALSSLNSSSNTAVTSRTVTTAATATGIGAANTRRVGTNTPTTLPNWNYTTSNTNNNALTNFTFLYTDGRITGTVSNGLGAGNNPAGMTLVLTRCVTSPGTIPLPPSVGVENGNVCTSGGGTIQSGSSQNVTVQSDGSYSVTVREGVYQIVPSLPYLAYTSSTPTQARVVIVGQGDVETVNFTAN